MKGKKIKDWSDNPLWLLAPVYPEEISVSELARAKGKSIRAMESMVLGLPTFFPIAERVERTETFLCFPTLSDKQRAMKWFAV